MKLDKEYAESARHGALLKLYANGASLTNVETGDELMIVETVNDKAASVIPEPWEMAVARAVAKHLNAINAKPADDKATKKSKADKADTSPANSAER